MSTGRTIFRRAPGNFISILGGTDAARSQQYPFYEGLVVDVILDHTHPEYAPDGYNVGSVKVRMFDVNQMASDDALGWADPIDFSVHEIPLIGELVSLFKIRGNFFYSRKIPIARRVQENAMLNLNVILRNKPDNSLSKKMISEAELTVDQHKFGKYFKPDSRVRQLRHFEGDTILQGRMGNSIRFGSSKMDPTSDGLAPNIILRTGQAKNVENVSCTTETVFGLIMEDPEEDVSSIWMTTQQSIPFRPITRDAASSNRSIKNAVSVYDKASILINSDKIVLNAKKQNVMIFANQDIYLNSVQRISLDTDDSIFMSANFDFQVKTSKNADFIIDEDFTVKSGSDVLLMSMDKASVISKKIFVGSVNNDVEPVVGGTSLSIFLARLIAVLMGPGIVPPQIVYQSSGLDSPATTPPPATSGIATFAHVITPVGPGQLNPAIVSGLTALYRELSEKNPGSKKAKPFSGAPFNSYDVFVNLANEDVSSAIELNKFEAGQPVEVENNTWKLSDTYYTVI